MRGLGRFASLGAVLAAMVTPGAQAQGKPKAVDACGVLSSADLTALTGDQFNRGDGEARPWMDAYVNYSCSYRGDQGWRVKLNIERGRDAEDVAGYFKALKGVATQTTATAPTPVSGLGDEAYWTPVNPTNGMLHVRVGTDVIWLQSWGRAPGAGTLAKTRVLMEKALAKFATLK